MSGLERDLADLEATDPAVADAARRLDETTAAIVSRSTSAQLRQTQAAFAASQADLTQAKKMRDLALTGLALARAELASAQQELARLRTQLGTPLRTEETTDV